MRFTLAPVLVLLAAAAGRPSDYSLPVEPPRPDAVAAAMGKVKARRAALDRLAGPHQPFDLTYLPRPTNEIQALYAFRPGLLSGHPDLAPAAAELASLGAQVLRRFGGNLAGPGLPELDQLLVCGSMTVTPIPNPTDGLTAQFSIGWTGFVVRSAKPYDWAAAVGVRLPWAELRTHNGVAFLAVRLNLGGFPGFPPGVCEVGFYPAPDGRTLVVDGVANVTELIDRRRDGKAVTPPPGWDKVDRAAVAVAIDNRNKQWVSHLPYHPGPVAAADGIRLFRAADQFAVGLDAGPVARFRVIAYCRDPFQAKHARAGMKEALARLSDHFAPTADEKPSPEWAELATLTDALLKDGTATPTPLGFEYVGETPGDLFGMIARLSPVVSAAQPEPPRPSASPAAAAPPGWQTVMPTGLPVVTPLPPLSPPPAPSGGRNPLAGMPGF